MFMCIYICIYACCILTYVDFVCMFSYRNCVVETLQDALYKSVHETSFLHAYYVSVSQVTKQSLAENLDTAAK
jgi:hypothetical protein